jgi:hypothetical protein
MLRKVKEFLSEYHSLINDDLTGYDLTSLMIASHYKCVSVVDFLLSCDGTEVNKQDKV